MHCLESGAAGLPAASLTRLGLLPWTLATWEKRNRKVRAMKNKKTWQGWRRHQQRGRRAEGGGLLPWGLGCNVLETRGPPCGAVVLTG